ncbi:MAG TPA: S1 family peptidase [Solirubrobacteraceae bacterium]|nr:S1 family peptidase [Solirubrobacteraceae bacterium]
MRKALVLVVPMLLALGLAGSSQADPATTTTEEAAWNSRASAERASSVMGVSTAQAAEDLEIQHAAFHAIGELIEAGDQVWFDNQTATVHVYGTSTVQIPEAITNHIVYDTTPPNFPASTKPMDVLSCGTSAKEYCSPLEAGVRLAHTFPGNPEADYCTAGFMVRSDSTGAPYMLTAGHCAGGGTTFYSSSFTTKTWPKKHTCDVGEPVTGDAPWGGYDVAMMPVTGCAGVIPYYHDWEFGTDTHVEGAINTQFVGEYVCHYGITSLYACGTIRAADVPSIVVDEGLEWEIYETDQVCGYAAPGDSGSPVTDGTYTFAATGLISAGGPSPSCGGTDTFWIEQRIFAALNIFGVYVAAS